MHSASSTKNNSNVVLKLMPHREKLHLVVTISRVRITLCQHNIELKPYTTTPESNVHYTHSIYSAYVNTWRKNDVNYASLAC